MREKKEQSEYFYNNETNILPFNISKIINLTFLEQEKLPQNIFDSLKKQNLPEFYIEQLLDDYDLYVFFISINNVINDVNLTSTWIIVELLKILNKNNIKILEISNSLKSNFLDLLLLIKKNEINQKQAKVLLEHLYASKKDVNQLIKELGMKQITNKNELEEIIMKILNNNKEMILQNKERVERIEKFIIGLVMKETKGQANPNIVKNLFDKLILCFI
jgi:aspartyl-tRNA(Asn)/glutamyl-tRNA(Gln) amidotransferase subunit B